MTISVKETIHHGDYFNVRSENIMPTWYGFTMFLLGSPYAPCAGNRAAMEINKYLAQAFASLLTTGHAEHGWARFDIN